MKNFLNYLAESHKTYEFRIKVANVDVTENMDRLESALNAYGLDSISKPKRLPLKESDIDFPSMKNCQLYLIDAVLTYPCNNDQLRAIIAERAGIPQANIVVVPKNHPEEIWRWNEDGTSDLKEYVKGEAVLDKPLPEASAEQKAAGEAYANATSILKELSEVKLDEAEGGKTETAKTTNDLPQGDASPVGSKQNKIPTAKK
jgi:hypothetical protein